MAAAVGGGQHGASKRCPLPCPPARRGRRVDLTALSSSSSFPLLGSTPCLQRIERMDVLLGEVEGAMAHMQAELQGKQDAIEHLRGACHVQGCGQGSMQAEQGAAAVRHGQRMVSRWQRGWAQRHASCMTLCPFPISCRGGRVAGAAHQAQHGLRLGPRLRLRTRPSSAWCGQCGQERENRQGGSVCMGGDGGFCSPPAVDPPLLPCPNPGHMPACRSGAMHWRRRCRRGRRRALRGSPRSASSCGASRRSWMVSSSGCKRQTPPRRRAWQSCSACGKMSRHKRHGRAGRSRSSVPRPPTPRRCVTSKRWASGGRALGARRSAAQRKRRAQVPAADPLPARAHTQAPCVHPLPTGAGGRKPRGGCGLCPEHRRPDGRAPRPRGGMPRPGEARGRGHIGRAAVAGGGGGGSGAGQGAWCWCWGGGGAGMGRRVLVAALQPATESLQPELNWLPFACSLPAGSRAHCRGSRTRCRDAGGAAAGRPTPPGGVAR